MALIVYPPFMSNIMSGVIHVETAAEYAHTAYRYLDSTLDTLADQIPIYYQTVWEHIPDFKTVVEHVPYHQTIAEYVPDYETVAGYVPDYGTLVEHVPMLEPIVEHVMEPLVELIEPVVENMPEKETVQQMFWDNLTFLHSCVKVYYLCVGILFLGYAIISSL